jgi:adenosine 3'-phospho 5'-phosphosulfate transporter B3
VPQVVLFSYSIGFVYLFFLVAVFTDIASAINYCSYYPKQTYGYAFIFSLTGYLGIQIVLSLVRQFGAFVAVTVTTFRKAISIVLSFVFFAKPFTYHYIYSGLLVLLGIYINLYAKNKDSSLVLTFNRIFYKVRRLLFVPKFHTEKSSTYNI